jgi:hypothetical protein
MTYIEQFWRDAEPEDAIKQPPRVARFRADDDTRFSSPITLCGARRRFSEGWFWYASDGGLWTVCQVYDPPAGFEIGEGWRLIDVDKDIPQEGDEKWLPGRWCGIHYSQRIFSKYGTYRRRIEPPKPKYVPFAWEDREQLRGRWIVDFGDENSEQMINKMDFNHDEFYANNKSTRQLLDNWRFLDTGEPVGKKVMQ